MRRRPGRRRRGWLARKSTRAAGGAIGPNGLRPVPERECRRRLSAVLPTRRSRTHREAMFWKNSMGDLSLSDIKSGGIRVQILTLRVSVQSRERGPMNELGGYAYADLRVGMCATFAKTVTEADIVLFAAVRRQQRHPHQRGVRGRHHFQGPHCPWNAVGKRNLRSDRGRGAG